MAVEVVMPKLGMAMKEGTVSLWSKAVRREVKVLRQEL
jgi:pyruvate dehydrogenase E2 component (dihydrolipoamide acetyltransferase)